MMINDRRDPDGPTGASTAMEATGASPHDRGAVEKTVAARNILESATATRHDRSERARRRRHLIPGEIEQKGLQGKDRLRTAMAPLRYVPSAQRERVFERTDYCREYCCGDGLRCGQRPGPERTKSCTLALENRDSGRQLQTTLYLESCVNDLSGNLSVPELR